MTEPTPALFPRDYEPIERWLPVVGWEGRYEVSNLGRVRSLDRIIVAIVQGQPQRRRVKGRILKPSHSSGYGYAQLQLEKGARRYIHTLVAEAFIGPRPEGMEVRHGPGGRLDNRVSNLSYGTHAQNNGPDKVRDGTDHNGDRGPNAQLTWEQVDEIRRLMPAPFPRARSKRTAGMPTQQGLAEQFGVSRWAIHDIVTGKKWRPEFRRDAS